MYARLEADGNVMIASEGNPKYPAKVGDHIGLSIGSTDSDRLTDRFGVNWNVDIEKG